MFKPQKTILCIEDDWEAAALLAEDLVERGYRVQLAHDGDEGLAKALSGRPDLVLCDINLPGLSGFDILERLTAVKPRFGYMPFIFLTAFTDRESQLRGRQLGADDYVTKPVDFDLLSAIIETRLARAVTDGLWPSNIALNTREVETLTWAARGKTSLEIAMIMGLSKRTVDFHADNARTKLGATTRIEATSRAAASRMIQP
jgi:DNA-binding response OmpR family regulator